MKSVTDGEDRVKALIEVMPDREKTGDGKFLHGPALKGEGITRDEIDKLFD